MASGDINKAAKYAALLDKAYKAEAKTSVLDAPPAAIRPTDSAATFYIQKLTLVGLGTYSKTAGFAAGDVTLEWEPYTYTQDRGRKFSVDAVDETEAMGVFGNVAGEFMRVHEVPEIDAYRISKLATGFGTDVADTISSGAEWKGALNLAATTLRNAEVDDGNMVLFITPDGVDAVENDALYTGIGCGIYTALKAAGRVVVVPQSRMVTAITVDDGSELDEGGWAKAAGAEDVNFILMDKGAAFADAKHRKVRVFDADTNQDADAWLFQFRIVHDCFVYANKVAGGYVHTKDAVS